MASFMEVANPRLATYVVGLPNDITCWSLGKRVRGQRHEAIVELYRSLIVARARGDWDDVYVFTEWEKGLLDWAIRKAKRRRR